MNTAEQLAAKEQDISVSSLWRPKPDQRERERISNLDQSGGHKHNPNESCSVSAGCKYANEDNSMLT